MPVLLLILVILFLLAVSSFIPIGNENSTVRRLPWVTFSIMALNVIIFFVTLPAMASDDEAITKTITELHMFVRQHQELMADEEVRDKLVKAGIISKADADAYGADVKRDVNRESDFKFWLRGAEAQKLREQLDEKLLEHRNATENSTLYHWGLAPNGDWKIHQLITSAFLHADIVHLFGNLLFFFAVAFSLEDLWGRGVFLSFYLLGAVVASLPVIVHPIPVPGLGASGAISATMGAFLFRLPKTKIKLFFIHFFWLRLIIFRGKLATYLVPGYIYLASYFIAQLISWYFDSKSGAIPSVGYSVHVAGFAFGAIFSLVMKATDYEEKHINPAIEAKVSFAAAPAALRRRAIAVAARHRVVAVTTIQAIVAVAAVHRVVAGGAGEVVVAVAAVEDLPGFRDVGHGDVDGLGTAGAKAVGGRDDEVIDAVLADSCDRGTGS